MRKLISMLLSTLMIVGLLPVTAFGAYSTINVIDTHDFVFYYNGQQSNYLKTVKDSIIDELVANEMLTEADLLEFAPTEDLIDEFLLENEFAFVLDVDSENYFETMYFMIDANLKSLSSVLEASQKVDITFETTTYNGLTVYLNDLEELAITTLDGNIVIAPDLETLKTVIDKYNNNQTTQISVSGKTAVISLKGEVLDSADPYQLTGGDFSGMTEEILFTVYEENGDFRLVSETTLNESQLSEMGITLSDYQGTPSLYKSLPANGAALYVEGTNLIDFISKLLSFAATESGVELTSEETSILEMVTQLSDAADGNIGFLVQQSSTGVVPYVTLVAEVNSQLSSQETLIDLNNQITNLITQDFLYGPVDNSAYLDKSFVSLNLNEIAPEEAPQEELIFNYGLAKGNTLYVISNNPNIQSSLTESGSLNSDVNFQNQLAGKLSGNNIVSASYLNTPQAMAALEDIILTMEAGSNEEAAAIITDLFTELKKLPALSSVSTLQGNNKLVEETEFSFPAETFGSLLTSFILATEASFNNYPTPDYDLPPAPYPQSQFDYPMDEGFGERFTDVDTSTIYNQWFGQELINLDYIGVVTGINNEFLAQNEMTRAEFITMLNRYYGLQGTTLGSDVFEDVSADAWYNAEIGIAYENGLIKGDDNSNTARPLDIINRGEAVTILDNFSTLYQMTSTEDVTYSFNDINTQDWFFTPAVRSYKLGIVLGRDEYTFAPYGKLTRGEAVVIIDRLRGSELASGYTLEVVPAPEMEMEPMDSEPVGAFGQLWG